MIAEPNVTCAITGATRVEQLAANLNALAITVTPEIDAALKGIFPVGSTWAAS